MSERVTCEQKLAPQGAHAPQFDARVIRVTGHWLMLDKPTEFADTLRDVVESIETGKAKRRPI